MPKRKINDISNMNNWCLYRHIRLDKNEVFYIGIGRRQSKKRNHTRPHRSSGRNQIWNRIVAKTDWKWQILFDDLSLEQAQEKEKEFIKLYGRINKKTGTLANLTDGGEGCEGLKMSNETKDKIRQKAIGRKATDETKSKLSESQRNRIREPFTDEHKRKISETRKLMKFEPYNKGISKYNDRLDEICKSIKEGLSESKICKLYNVSNGALYRIKQSLKQIENEK